MRVVRVAALAEVLFGLLPQVAMRSSDSIVLGEFVGDVDGAVFATVAADKYAGRFGCVDT